MLMHSDTEVSGSEAGCAVQGVGNRTEMLRANHCDEDLREGSWDGEEHRTEP